MIWVHAGSEVCFYTVIKEEKDIFCNKETLLVIRKPGARARFFIVS